MNRPKTVSLRDYRPYSFVIEKAYLHVDLFTDHTQVKMLLHFRRNPLTANQNEPLYLNGEHLELEAVLLNGNRLKITQDYMVDDQSLSILHVPEHGILETWVTIRPHLNKSLMGLYQTGDNFCTQCEAEGFRRITYFPDRPDVMTRFTTTITADQGLYPVLLSNGNLIDQKSLPEGRHWVCWEDPSLKPCYLFALVAGRFDRVEDMFETKSGRRVDLHLYLEPGFLDQGQHAIDSLKRAMNWDEKNYGREYDLSVYMIVAVSDFNMGAMENKGLNIFNTRYILAKPETATDEDFIAVEGVIAHEYFHNWTGNRITCRDWFQLTLKEGLTVFRDQDFTEDMTSVGVARIDTVTGLRNTQFPEDASPLAHPIRPQEYMEINNFYTATVYRKGAEIIRMIRTLIGHENFHRGMDLYFTRHDGQAVTTEDFVKVMEDASGYDLTQFRNWYDQVGTPHLKITSHYDASTQKYQLSVHQNSKPLHIPLSMALLNPRGGTRIHAKVLSVTEKEQVFHFENVYSEPLLSLLRGFSAPVIIEYNYSDEELLALFELDQDMFSRFEAGQQYIKRLLFQPDASSSPLLHAYHHILVRSEPDKQYLARLLTLPSFSYLMQNKEGTGIETLDAARAFLEKLIGLALKDLWVKYYEAYKDSSESPDGSYVFSMKEVGRRAVKNLALYYLCATCEAPFYELAYQQFLKSNNMTEQMGALWALNNRDTPLRDQALNAFYEQWKDQPLVVNKWLTVQASSLLYSTFQRVQDCMKHPAFNRYNPNNVYALLGAFGNNLPRFHQWNGVVYPFMADQVIEMDAYNPQMAGRIVQPFARWKQLDTRRQNFIKPVLERIVNTDKISKDLYELVSKMLDVSYDA